jgi:biopolymer transport protein ExbD
MKAPHDTGGAGIKAEPNLVPLLDLTFQLIMFFMICVNFVSEQVSEGIHLPEAQSARPMEKSEIDVLFLNLDSEGKVMALGRQQPLLTASEIKYYLRQQYEDAKRAAERRGDKSGKVGTAIILRADKNVDYAHVYDVMQLCKDVGYRRLQLRAYTRAGG